MTLRGANTLLVLLAVFPPGRIHAGGGPQNIAVIVNPSDPDSLAVANAYVELRRIPPLNVFYFPWSAGASRTTGAQFRDRLLKPLLEQIDERGLTAQIEGVAFSTGFPYLVDCTATFPGKQFPPQNRPIASLTSAVYLHQFLLAGREELFALNANLYYSPVVEGYTTSRAFAAPPPPGQSGAAPQRPPYLLATALGVSHGRGNPAAEIIASLERAKQADGAKPRGTIYFLKNNDVRSRARHDTYPGAVRELIALGVKAEILPGAVPNGKKDVAGFTTGAPRLNLRASGCTLLPGALIDNLTSSAGQFVIPDVPNPQTPISEYIRMGAAGASGTVVEPFAIAEKFPSPHVHVHYARGCSLAESFYQAVAGPAQLIVVGDPLCQPWAIPPSVAVEGVAVDEAIKGTVQITPTAKYPNARVAQRFELFVDGVRKETIFPGGKFGLVTGTLADGWHELRVVAIDNTPIAVQGAWIASVQVKNGNDALQISAPASTRTPLGGSLTIEITSTAKEDAAVFHNGRRLGVVAGGSGKLLLDAKLLGKGRVELYAQQPAKPTLRSRPLAIEVY